MTACPTEERERKGFNGKTNCSARIADIHRRAPCPCREHARLHLACQSHRGLLDLWPVDQPDVCGESSAVAGHLVGWRGLWRSLLSRSMVDAKARSLRVPGGWRSVASAATTTPEVIPAPSGGMSHWRCAGTWVGRLPGRVVGSSMPRGTRLAGVDMSDGKQTRKGYLHERDQAYAHPVCGVVHPLATPTSWKSRLARLSWHHHVATRRTRSHDIPSSDQARKRCNLFTYRFTYRL